MVNAEEPCRLAANPLQGIAEGAMALSFPPYFPKDFLDPVVAAESAAERQFRKADAEASGDHRCLRLAASQYVIALVLAFARQACAAVRASKFSLSAVGAFVDDFERRASVHAFYDLGLSRLWYRWEAFRDDVIPQIHQSPGWLEHLDDRARCADSSPAGEEKDIRDRAQRRAAVIEPLLKDRNLTKSKWADEAGVDPSVVYDYMAGKSNPRPENRRAMAGAIGGQDLPD